MKKTTVKDLITEYVSTLLQEASAFIPLLIYYRISWEEEDRNPTNGYFSVGYEPTTFKTEIYIYKGLLTRSMDPVHNKLPEKFKNYLKMNVCHELGHIFLWELGGDSNQIEKTATLIGNLIHTILDGKNI